MKQRVASLMIGALILIAGIELNGLLGALLYVVGGGMIVYFTTTLLPPSRE